MHVRAGSRRFAYSKLNCISGAKLGLFHNSSSL